MKNLHLLSLAVLLLNTSVLAQGANDCNMAQAISGTGSFPFDNTNATIDGSPDPLCDAFGTQDIDFDVWFAWTAPTSNIFVLDTCTSSVDTKVAAYDGACGGPILACNDDSCGLQSRISFTATTGQTYLLRIGTFPGAAGGAGTFTIDEATPVLNPANGHQYLAVFESLDWPQAKAAAEAAMFMGQPGHLATISDAAEDQFVYFTLVPGGLGNAWLGAEQNFNAPGFAEPAGGWEWVTGEPFTYTNWLPGEPNDGGGQEHYLGYWPADQWNDYQVSDGAVGAYVIEWDTGAVIGTNFCVNVPNSSGQAATITAAGSLSLADQDVTLNAEGCPANVSGIFFLGTTQTLLPFGDGFRCIALPISRIPPFTFADSNGVAMRPLDFAAPYATNLLAGSVVSFQYWYRDAAGGGTGFNLTNGVELPFVP